MVVDAGEELGDQAALPDACRTLEQDHLAASVIDGVAHGLAEAVQLAHTAHEGGGRAVEVPGCGAGVAHGFASSARIGRARRSRRAFEARRVA
ncbi:MAG: hypothetical protein R3F60_17450 [bacterium]